MAEVFMYKGWLGINGLTGEGEGKKSLTPAAINNPFKKGQLGTVCDLRKCKVTKEAKEYLKTLVEFKSRDAIGSIDVFQSNDMPILSWMGNPLFACNTRDKSEDPWVSRDYDPSVLDNISDAVIEIPADFKEMVDGK